MKENLTIVKISGNIIDEEQALYSFLYLFAALPGKKILVHGGGKLATRLASDLQIPQQMMDGRRITDAETLKIVTMVYAGYINKNIVAHLQMQGCDALGLSGADGNLIRSHKRIKGELDFGFVGDVDEVNNSLISKLLDEGNTLVIAPITHDGKGQLLNTNADTIAQELAKGLADQYSVQLTYTFEKEGVLTDAHDENTVIPVITPSYYLELKEKQLVFAGMIPKLDNAFQALESGVASVIIGKADKLDQLISGKAGTRIKYE